MPYSLATCPILMYKLISFLRLTPQPQSKELLLQGTTKRMSDSCPLSNLNITLIAEVEA